MYNVHTIFLFPSNSTYYGKHFGNLILCTFNLKQWFFSHVTLILCRSKLYSRTAKIVYREAECETPNYTLFNLWAYMGKECSIYCTYNRINVFPHIFIIIIICSWVHKINLTPHTTSLTTLWNICCWKKKCCAYAYYSVDFRFIFLIYSADSLLNFSPTIYYFNSSTQ